MIKRDNLLRPFAGGGQFLHRRGQRNHRDLGRPGRRRRGGGAPERAREGRWRRSPRQQRRWGDAVDEGGVGAVDDDLGGTAMAVAARWRRGAGHREAALQERARGVDLEEPVLPEKLLKGNITSLYVGSAQTPSPFLIYDIYHAILSYLKM